MSEIKRVAVLGAGTMGHGIAQISAQAGYTVRLYDSDTAVLQPALRKIDANLAKGIQRGKVSEAQASQTRANLQLCKSVEEAVEAADIVIEAAPEELAIKQELARTATAIIGSDAIFATNTSSLSIAKIADSSSIPANVIGTHFFNPAHIMKLLELIVADVTSQATLERTIAFGKSLGKECITVKDVPGFATSRLGLVIGLEAIRMVQSGVASPEDIDKAMTLGYGFPMGPLRLTDLVGLDVRLRIADYLSKALPNADHFRPPTLLRQMVAEGKLGKKAGQGFYKWDS